jgi:hypothetical protein
MRYGLLLTTLIATVVSAQQSPPAPPKVYLVNGYLSLSQQGRAYVIGPFDAQACGQAAERAKTNPPPYAEDVPPDEQLQASICVTKDQLPAAMYSWGCSATESAAVPKMPGVKLWFYRCFRG